MGQGLSNDVCISDDKNAPKSIMFLTLERESFVPVSVSSFFGNLNHYLESVFLIIEPPSDCTKPRNAIPTFRKVSLMTTMQAINQKYKISPMIINDLKIWIFSLNSQASKEKMMMMKIVKETDFSRFSSKIEIMPNFLFLENELPSSISDAIKKYKKASHRSEAIAIPLALPQKDLSKTQKIRLSLDTNSLFAPGSQPNYQTIQTSPKRAKAIYIDSCDKICDGLYISGEKIASDLETLQKNGITHIINVNAGASPINFPTMFQYFSVHLDDSVFEVLNDEFWSAVEFLNKTISSGGRVLVHCRKGISRSAALCLAYLIEYKKMVYSDALEMIKSARPIVDINNGFSQQILSHYKKDKN